MLTRRAQTNFVASFITTLQSSTDEDHFRTCSTSINQLALASVTAQTMPHLLSLQLHLCGNSCRHSSRLFLHMKAVTLACGLRAMAVTTDPNLQVGLHQLAIKTHERPRDLLFGKNERLLGRL